MNKLARLLPLPMLVTLACGASGQNQNGHVQRPAPAAAVLVAPKPATPEEPPGTIAPLPNDLGPFSEGVYSIATTTGLVAISVARSPTVWLVDSARGIHLGELSAPTEDIYGLSFSPDGKHLAAISRDQSAIYVWEVQAHSAARIVKRAAKVWSVAVLAGGEQVVVGGEGGLFEIVAVDSGATVRAMSIKDAVGKTFPDGQVTVFSITVSPSGRWVGAIAGGRVVLRADLEHGGALSSVVVDEKLRVASTTFSPDDHFLLARGSTVLPPKTVRVGRRPDLDPSAANAGCHAGDATLSLLGVIGGLVCDSIVNSVAKSGDPTVEVTGLAGGLLLWDLGANKSVLVRAFGRLFVNAAWSPDSSKVVVVADAPFEGGDLVRRVQTYPREQFTSRSSQLPPPIDSLMLGRSRDFFFNAIAGDAGTLFMEHRRQPVSGRASSVQIWSIPSLTVSSDAAGGRGRY